MDADTLVAPAATNPPRSVQMPMQQRDLQLRAETFSPEARTVEVVWSTGARRAMMNWDTWEMVDEELALDAGSVRLDRLNSGAPVLDTHSRYELENVIGVVVDGSARIEGGQGVATVRLSAREDLAPLVADIASGIIRNISVGYMVHKYEITAVDGQRQLWRAVDWEPFEISFVPVPADAGAQARGHDAEQGGNPCILHRATAPTQEPSMAENEPAVAAPAVAVIETRAPAPAAPAPVATPAAPVAVTGTRLLAAVRAAGLTPEALAEIQDVHAVTPLDERGLMAEIGTRFAARDLGTPQRNNISVARDEGDTMRAGMIEATLHRMTRSAPLTELGRGYRGLGLEGVARELLGARGESTRALAPVEIAARAMMTSSDLPYILQNVMNKRLRMSYDENLPSYQIWAKRAPNARDFKTISVSQLSAMPDLSQVGEGGEVKLGAISDGVVTYALTSYAKLLAFSRQMVINDDLGALDRWAVGFSASARRLENRTVYGQLTSSTSYKSGNLFTSGQGNLAASGAVISGTTLNQARSAMRLQKGLQSEELNIAPRFLIVPTALEQLAYQYTSSNFVPAKASDVNEFRAGGRTAIEPVVEAILDATSATAYYFAADSAQCDTIEYCFLDGAEGVQLESTIDFDSGGLKLRASEDFAAAPIDYRGFYKNPGA